jgi:ketose-bisphosphate aldolase
MLAKTVDLLQQAHQKGVAVGAFNTYTLELTRAIINAAEQLQLPIILQLGVQPLKAGGEPLAVATLTAARTASVPVAVHLDHCSDMSLIETCLSWGFSSVMADGAHLSLADNIAFTRQAVTAANRYGAAVEAELGYLAGTEDGITIEALAASLTDPDQAQAFITATGATLLAVSIGNVHGYVPNPPELDFARLERIAAQVTDTPLVLHGASGLPIADVQRAIHIGVAKVNVNTEVRTAFLKAIAGWGLQVGPEPDVRKKGQDLLDVLRQASNAATEAVAQTLATFNFRA